jgi:hypothetical protein
VASTHLRRIVCRDWGLAERSVPVIPNSVQIAWVRSLAAAQPRRIAGDYLGAPRTFTFTFDLKRVSTEPPVIEAAASPAVPPARGARRESVPQPLQQQKLEYFQGQWKFKWLGMESLLGPGGSKEGTLTYTPILDGKFLEGRAEGTLEGSDFREINYLGWDAERKLLTSYEQRSVGAAILGLGDWNSPIAIRFTIPPLKIKGQNLQLKKIITIVAAHSFTVTEELSVDGGPFQRLGSGVFTRVETK